MGLELPVSVAFVFISPLLLQAGFTGLHSSLILCCGSVIGLFFAPVFGFFSDYIHTPIGRRRPFIILLSICVCFSLFLLPEVRKLKHMLSVFVILLDSTSQICLSSYEALLADIFLNPYGMYSVMLNLGSMLGYLFAYIDWSSYFSRIYDNFNVSMISLQSQITSENDVITGLVNSNSSLTLSSSLNNEQVNIRIIFTAIGCIFTLSFLIAVIFGKEKSYPTSTIGTTPIKRFSLFPNCYIDNIPSWKVTKNRICPSINRLLLADGLSWASILCFKFFFSDYVGQFIFNGHPYPSSNATSETKESLLSKYNDGIRAASLLLFYQSLTASVFSLIIQRAVDRIGCKKMYLIGLLSFGCSIGSIVLFQIENYTVISIMLAFSGIGCACATALPFILLTRYHENKPYYFEGTSDILDRGIGGDIGLLDASYFACQVSLFAIIGFIYKISLQATLIASSVLAFCASVAIYCIVENVSIKRTSTSKSIYKSNLTSKTSHIHLLR
ncbi:hypothetical protein GJ496_011706 [Pomphorhynchus laevis]|nr:hypothetical protein GJ496_011706 [Pomphorhynchus laevis]